MLVHENYERLAKMFSVIRLFFSGLIFGCSALVINKLKPQKAKKYIRFFLIISIVIYVVLSYIPFENSFITFDSVKSAIEYYNPKNSNIELVVPGEDCDFVVIKGDNITRIYSIIPKTSDGWKVGTGKDVEIVSQRFIKGFSVHVYRYKKTNNYFVTILNSAGGELVLNDTYNSEFQVIERYNEQLGESYFTYYAHVIDFDKGYHVDVETEDGSVHRFDFDQSD